MGLDIHILEQIIVANAKCQRYTAISIDKWDTARQYGDLKLGSPRLFCIPVAMKNSFKGNIDIVDNNLALIGTMTVIVRY